MTTPSDRDRAISRWLEAEAPDRAPEDLLEASRDRIRTTQQRRPFWPVRRGLQMSNYLRLGGLAAAVIVIAAAGTALMLGGGIGGPTGAPSTVPTAGSPTGPPPTGPAATDAALLPGEFTACVPPNSELRAGTYERDIVPGSDGDMMIERTRGFTWGGSITATDPRFTGMHYTSWDANGYTPGSANPGTATVEGQASWAEGHRIENDEGAWSGSAVGLTLPDGTNAAGPVVLTGERAYEGLTAVLLYTDGPCFFDFRGLLMKVPDPPVPFTGD